MDAHTSFDLLAHFDEAAKPTAVRVLPTLGVGWVLKWAVALAVLFVAASILTEFGCCLAAEHALSRAARAGALEATLPRATYETVVESVSRRLTGYSLSRGELRLHVLQNGAPVRGRFEVSPGDEFAVTVSLPTSFKNIEILWVPRFICL